MERNIIYDVPFLRIPCERKKKSKEKKEIYRRSWQIPVDSLHRVFTAWDWRPKYGYINQSSRMPQNTDWKVQARSFIAIDSVSWFNQSRHSLALTLLQRVWYSALSIFPRLILGRAPVIGELSSNWSGILRRVDFTGTVCGFFRIETHIKFGEKILVPIL